MRARVCGCAAPPGPSSSSLWIFGYGSLIHRPGFPYSKRVVGCIKGWRRVWWQGSTDHRGTPENPGRTVTLEQDPGAVTWGVAYQLAGTHEQQRATLQYLEHREKQYDERLRLDLWGWVDQLAVVQGPEALADSADGTEPCSTGTPGTSAAAPSGGARGGDGARGGEGAGAGASIVSLEVQAESGGGGGGAGAPSATLHSHHTSVAADGSSVSASCSRSVGQDDGRQLVLLLTGVLCYVATSDLSRNANFLGPATMDELALQIARAAGPSGPNAEYVAKLAGALREMGVLDPELEALEQQVAAAVAALAAQQPAGDHTARHVHITAAHIKGPAQLGPQQQGGTTRVYVEASAVQGRATGGASKEA